MISFISKWNITAWSNIENRRVHLFRWTRAAEDGIRSAKQSAEIHERGEELSDYRAEKINDH